jgi:hypothetical protein
MNTGLDLTSRSTPANITTYSGAMESPDEPTQDPRVLPLNSFLSQPAYSAEEDAEESVAQQEQDGTHENHRDVSLGKRFRRWFAHFMFEKEPSQYSSIAPRSPDGTRSKIFFFNGNGRGR